MNLYNLHNHPESIHNHHKQDTHVPEYIWNKYHDNPNELKKRESAIATNIHVPNLYNEYFHTTLKYTRPTHG